MMHIIINMGEIAQDMDNPIFIGNFLYIGSRFCMVFNRDSETAAY